MVAYATVEVRDAIHALYAQARHAVPDCGYRFLQPDLHRSIRLARRLHSPADLILVPTRAQLSSFAIQSEPAVLRVALAAFKALVHYADTLTVPLPVPLSNRLQDL